MSKYIPTKRPVQLSQSDDDEEQHQGFVIGFQPDDKRQQLLKRHASDPKINVRVQPQDDDHEIQKPTMATATVKRHPQAAFQPQHQGLSQPDEQQPQRAAHIPVQQLLGDIWQQTQAAFGLPDAVIIDTDGQPVPTAMPPEAAQPQPTALEAAAPPQSQQQQGNTNLQELLAKRAPAAAASTPASIRKAGKKGSSLASLMYSTPKNKAPSSSASKAAHTSVAKSKPARFGIREATPSSSSSAQKSFMQQLRPLAGASSAPAKLAQPDDAPAAPADLDASSFETPAAALKTSSRLFANDHDTPAAAAQQHTDTPQPPAAATGHQHQPTPSASKGQLSMLLQRASALKPPAAAPVPHSAFKKPNPLAHLMYPSSACKTPAASRTPAAASDSPNAAAALSAQRSAQASFLAKLPAVQAHDVTFSAPHKSKSSSNFNSLSARLQRQLQLQKHQADKLAAGQQPADCIVAHIVGQPLFEAHVTKCLCRCQEFPSGYIHLLVPSKATEAVVMQVGSVVRVVPPWQELHLEGEQHPVVAAAMVA